MREEAGSERGLSEPSETLSGLSSRGGGWQLGHVVTAIGLAVTIIGLPFAWAHLKLAGLSLWPIGRTVVSRQEADQVGRGTPAPRT